MFLFGICTHSQILRRRNARGAMGWECFDCHHWWPLARKMRGRSRLALRLMRRQALASRRARELQISPQRLEKLVGVRRPMGTALPADLGAVGDLVRGVKSRFLTASPTGLWLG